MFSPLAKVILFQNIGRVAQTWHEVEVKGAGYFSVYFRVVIDTEWKRDLFDRYPGSPVMQAGRIKENKTDDAEMGCDRIMSCHMSHGVIGLIMRRKSIHEIIWYGFVMFCHKKYG